MSIFSKVAHFFGGAINDVVSLAKRVFGAIGTVWAFLVSAATLVTEAWNWIVNGVTWFTSELSNWAAAVYTVAWHTLTNIIPKAAEWAFRQATSWAGSALHTVEHFLSGLIHTLRVWSERELRSLAHAAKGWVKSVIEWVTAPIRWIYNVAKHVVNLVLHPRALVEWFIGSLIEPLVMWFLRSGVNVVVWLMRLAVRESSEVAHLLEEMLERVV